MFNNPSFNELSGTREEVNTINKRSKVLALLSVLAVAVIMSGILLTTQAANSTGTSDERTNGSSGLIYGSMGPGRCGWSRGGLGGWGPYGHIQVSTEFQDKVISIAENDTDVQALLNDGYNVTGVRPIITATVNANGSVTMQATTAVVTLEKNTTGRASVLVDLEQGKVTQIVISTRTVIDKP